MLYVTAQIPALMQAIAAMSANIQRTVAKAD